MRLATLAAAFLTLALSGCLGEPGRLAPDRMGPPAPAGTPVVREAVDGLVVGHRLMAAGEYELALRAYQRAAVENGLTADVLSAMGSANLRLGRLSQSETLLRAAVEKEPDFPAAWNNLGVVLMEQGRTAEAASTFRNAFGLDNGASEEIKANLTLALAMQEKTVYTEDNDEGFRLVRRGNGRYLLLSTP